MDEVEIARVTVALTLAIGGIVLYSVGRRARDRQLRRSAITGIRLPAHVSDELWEDANRAAAPLLQAGGVIGVVGAVSVAATRTEDALIVAVLVTCFAVVVAVIGAVVVAVRHSRG